MSGAEPAAEERGSGAYREPGVAPSFPAEQIAWRRSVAQGAVWLVVFAGLKYLALTAMAASPLVATAVLTPLEIGLCFATWKLTAREPGRTELPEWVALFVLADGRAKAFNAGGRLGYFTSRNDAEAWLGEHGLLPDEALAAQAE